MYQNAKFPMTSQQVSLPMFSTG